MKDIKINDAAYFPRPQAIYKELPINKAMGAEAGEYMKAWTFNGLFIIASAGEYDDENIAEEQFVSILLECGFTDMTTYKQE